MSNIAIKTTCPVCGNCDVSYIDKYRYHHAVFAACSLVTCNHCHLSFADPMPGKELLKEYNAGYFENAHGGMQTHPLTLAFHSAINLLRVVHIEKFLKNQHKTVNSVLEIGPGGGFFARHWLQRNPGTTQYTGVESDRTCHENLIRSGVVTFLTVDDIPSDRQFDLVVISHVLEHTDDPIVFLNSCTQQLSSGGTLFIEVPCKDFEHKEQDEPHLLFFDKQPMQILLNRVGFKDIRVSYHGNTIEDLKKGTSILANQYQRFKRLLFRMGIYFPFSYKSNGLQEVANPLERAMVKPFKAHLEQNNPAWWLRAVAIKN